VDCDAKGPIRIHTSRQIHHQAFVLSSLEWRGAVLLIDVEPMRMSAQVIPQAGAVRPDMIDAVGQHADGSSAVAIIEALCPTRPTTSSDRRSAGRLRR